MADSYLYKRHALPTRIMHWVNVLSFTTLLMSGLMIFNAHPSLDWGKQSYSGQAPVLQISNRMGADGKPKGYLKIFNTEFETTGLLGISAARDGTVNDVAFPWWMTIPSDYSLSEARLWHLFFAWILVINGLFYLIHGFVSKHMQKDLIPHRSDWRTIGASIIDHIKFKHPQGEDAKRYNILQRLAYVSVIFVLLPLIILGGWSMSPWLNSLAPGWVDLLGGRQSARTIHFVVAWLLVGFIGIHVFEVIISGFWNHIRSMITGNYRIKKVQHDKIS